MGEKCRANSPMYFVLNINLFCSTPATEALVIECAKCAKGVFCPYNFYRNDERAKAQTLHSATGETSRRDRRRENATYTQNPYSRIVFMRRVVQRRRQFGVDNTTNGGGSAANFSGDRAARQRHGCVHWYDHRNDFGRLYALEQWLRQLSRIR
jgi:hypothetical protein